ncbi:MAG: phosphoribosylanthranilate isomerase [Actinobacteria bacterium]|nr:phosphoribosylanthranilate isomerase [Actinomycetota bacterium]
MWVKICGITRACDAEDACRLGADAIGFIFAESPRRVSVDKAAAICRKVPAGVLKVGVFVDSPVLEILETKEECGLDCVQLHGRESAAYCEMISGPVIKAVRVGPETDLNVLSEYPCGRILLDGFYKSEISGRERELFWENARVALEGKQLIVAGGLDPGNVSAAVRRVKPFGVDAASGVESFPGIKRAELIGRFVERAHLAGQEVNR